MTDDRFNHAKHEAVQAAKERSETAREQAEAKRQEAEDLLSEAEALTGQAREATRAGDDEEADRLLQRQQDLKARAERAASIAEAKAGLAKEAEAEFRATIDKVKKELASEAKVERARRLLEVAEAHDRMQEALERAREIDGTYAALIGHSAVKVLPKEITVDRPAGRGTTSLRRYMEHLRERGEKHANLQSA